MEVIGASENLVVLESWGGGGTQVQGQGLGGSLGKWGVWRWLEHKKLWLDLAIPCVLCSSPAPCLTGSRHSSFKRSELAFECHTYSCKFKVAATLAQHSTSFWIFVFHWHRGLKFLDLTPCSTDLQLALDYMALHEAFTRLGSALLGL